MWLKASIYIGLSRLYSLSLKPYSTTAHFFPFSSLTQLLLALEYKNILSMTLNGQRSGTHGTPPSHGKNIDGVWHGLHPLMFFNIRLESLP